MPRADTPTGVVREFRSAATRLERIARQLPPDSKAKVNETIQLLRAHADRLVGLTRPDPIAGDKSTEG